MAGWLAGWRAVRVASSAASALHPTEVHQATAPSSHTCRCRRSCSSCSCTSCTRTCSFCTIRKWGPGSTTAGQGALGERNARPITAASQAPLVRLCGMTHRYAFAGDELPAVVALATGGAKAGGEDSQCDAAQVVSRARAQQALRHAPFETVARVNLFAIGDGFRALSRDG